MIHDTHEYHYGIPGPYSPGDSIVDSFPTSQMTPAVVNALNASAPGLGSEVMQAQAPGESWMDTLGRLLQSVVLADSQRRLLNINLERARQGLPPISGDQAGQGFTLGLDRNTRNMLMIGGGVIAALIVFNALRRR